MGKKKVVGEPTKGQQIEQYLAEHPDASPNQIAAGLAEQGISVSVSMANNVKSKLRAARGGRKKVRRKRKAARTGMAAQPATSRTAGDGLSAKDLFEAKRLVDQLGGINQARQALEMLAKLQ